MEFRKVGDKTPVVDFLSRKIKSKLSSGQKVLWLVPGGSNISTAVSVSKNLRSADLAGLTVTLTDERFGPLAHNDSNWLQLKQAGFKLPGAALKPVLTDNDPQETADEFDSFLDDNFKKTNYCLALMGIGADSHIAGIKPLSPATEVESLAAYYVWEDFERVTMTFPAILKLDCVVAYPSGQNKRLAITSLAKELEPHKYPAQILKQAKQAIIFNDWMEGKL